VKARTSLTYLLIALLFSFSKCFASESILNFNSFIQINTNGTVDFTEKILYDFGNAQKHGIIREIPITKVNIDKKIYKMDFSGVSVYDTLSLPVPFTTKSDGTNLRIQIGDANKLVTGQKLYDIRYKVSGAVTYFTDHDELYWNITGNLTQVPIQKVESEISVPFKAVSAGDIKAECFTGMKGETRKDCLVSVFGNKVLTSTNSSLNAEEGITVVVSLPKGIVQIVEPTETKSVEMSLIQKIVTFAITAVFLAGGFFWYVFYPIKIFLRWLKERKNTKSKERIVAAWFESPETLDKRSLTPAETGALVDKDVDHKDISATIIDLAQRGFIKIKVDEKKEASVQKIINYSESKELMSFEKDLLDGLFSNGTLEVRRISDLTSDTSFFRTISNFKRKVSRGLYDGGLFKDDPIKTDIYYSVIGVIAFITFNIILGFVSLLLGRKSARRTDLGIEKYSEAVSLKNFLVSQGDQINFQSQNQMFFEKLLPYATAFGVERIWAKRFEGLKFAQPDWYEGDISNVTAFSVISSSLNNSIRSNISSMSSTRSSSGFSSGFSGGHSGGGGGGGGTSSW
jgi:uncharacterized membrane protein YgcG